MNKTERRRFHRFPFDASCRLLAAGREIRCSVLDLSLNGLLLRLEIEPGLGLTFPGMLDLNLVGSHDGEKVYLEAQVRAVRVHADLLACRFVGMPADSFDRLKALVRSNLGDMELLNRELTQLDYWPGLSISSGE